MRLHVKNRHCLLQFGFGMVNCNEGRRTQCSIMIKIIIIIVTTNITIDVNISINISITINININIITAYCCCDGQL